MKNFIYYLLLLTTTWGFMATAALAQNCPLNTNVSSNTTPNGTTITWDAVAGAMQYELRYRKAGTSALTAVFSTTNSFTFTTLPDNVCYEFALRTICSGNDIGPWLFGQSFCTAGPSGFCAIPSNITSTPMVNNATLNWSAVAGAQAYEIRYRKVGTAALSYLTTTTNSIFISGLVSNTCYEFSIRSQCDSNNFSPWLIPGQSFCTQPLAQPCTIPSNINTTHNPNATILSWNAVSNAIGYEIRYREVGTSALTYASTATNSLALSNLMENTCYEFSIRSQCDSLEFSPWLIPGQSFCVPGSSGFCAIPSNITSAPTVNDATLNWSAVAGAQAYEIRYREVGTGPVTYATTTTNSISIGGLMSNTCYEFSIRSQCDTNNFSSWLIPGQSFCTQPLAQPCTIPSNINTTHNPNATILSWNAVSNAIGYEIRYREVGTSALTYVSTATNSLALSNLMENTCYEFSIRSQCDSLEFSPWLIPGQSFCVPGSSGFCAIPNNIISTPTANAATLNWSAVAGAQAYEIRYREVGTSALTYTTTTTNSLTLNGLMASTCYEFSIRTQCDSNNFSPWLIPGQSFCVPGSSGFCVTPSNITSTTTSTTAQINWMALNNAQGYELRYREVGTGPVTYASSTSNSTILSGLMPNTCYEFSIRAQCDSNNFSPWLIPGLSFCTDSMVNMPCPVPTNLNDSVGPNFAFLYWNSNTSANFGYQVRYRVIGTNMYTSVFTNNPSTYIQNLPSNTCYDYNVRTICDTIASNDFSSWSSNQIFCTDSIVGPCPVPTFVLVDSISTTFATVSWVGNSSANFGYQVRYRRAGTTAYNLISTNNPSAFIGNLSPDSCYFVSVRTRCTFQGSSAWSNPIFFCTDSTSFSCPRPTNPSADTTTTTLAYLSWDGSSNANFGYEVRYAVIGGNYTTFVTGTTTPVLQNLQPGTCYTFNVRAICDTIVSNDFSPWSSNVNFCTDSIVLPPCPLPMTINDSAGINNVLLYWSAVSGAQGYEIRYREVGTGPVTYASSSDNSEFLFNLMPGTCYEYSVRTVCDSTLGNYSPWLIPGQSFCTDTIALPPCPAPTNTNVDSVGFYTAVLSWMGNTSATFGYEIRYRALGTSNYTFVAVNGTAVSLSNLQDQTCYEYSVRSVCDTISPNYSPWMANNVLCTDTLPCTPPNNIVDSVGTYFAYLTWNGNNSANFGYEIRYRAFGTTNFTVLQTNNPSIYLYNLQDATCYLYSVRSICDSLSGEYSSWTNSEFFCTDTLPCATPTNFGELVDTTSAFLDWSNASRAQGYEIRYRRVGTTALTYVTTSSSDYFLSNLMDGTCYEYSVRTICDSTIGDYSPWLVPGRSFCTDSIPLPPCSMPTNFAELADTTSALLDWSTVSGAHGYEIRYREVGTSALTYISSNDSEEFLTGLMPGTCYEYSVRTLCDSVIGNYSPWLVPGRSFCTDTIFTSPCPMPINANVDSVGQHAVLLSWTGNSNATFGYEIRYRDLNSSNYQFVTVYNTSAFINLLQDQTCYEYNVRSICDTINPNYSAWTANDIFCTSDPSSSCPTTTNTFISNLNPTFASFNWLPVAGAVSYEVRFRLLGTNNAYNLLYSFDTTAFYQGFQPGACYEYNVRTQCDTINSSNYTYSLWSSQDTFCVPTMRLNGSNGTATTVDNFHSITKGEEDTPIRYTVFPNPTTGQVTIKFDQALTTAYTVRVFNILGAEVTPTVLKRGEEVCILNLFSLTNGLYMIEISTAQQRWTEQIQVYK